MEFTNFKNSVKKEVERKIGENCTVIFNDTTKNNGVVLSGLQIKSKNSNIAPVIYLDDYYVAYENGDAEFEAIIDNILMVYEIHKIDYHVDTSPFLNYENVRDRVIYKLINTDRNTELLQHMPHIAFHDLSIVFQVAITGNGSVNVNIPIHNGYMATWDVSLDRLYEDACRNTPIINKGEIKDVDDAIRELMLSEEPEESEEMELGAPSIFVLSNSCEFQGSACILYPGLLKEFADSINSNLYIIPMTVHNVLLLPTEKPQRAEYEGIKSEIRAVNDIWVSDEDILSYSVYYYDRNTDETIKL